MIQLHLAIHTKTMCWKIMLHYNPNFLEWKQYLEWCDKIGIELQGQKLKRMAYNFL